MEKPTCNRTSSIAMEENTLTILDDYSWSKQNAHYAHDDRIAFIKAVRDGCIVPEKGTPPTYKMYEAVFGILGTAESLELLVASYRLLNELEKRYPRSYLSKNDTSNSSDDLVMIKETWSPFVLDSETRYSERGANERNFSAPLDISGFCHLIQNLAEVANGTNLQAISVKSLGNMLLFQYLVSVLQEDFILRNNVYKVKKDWILVRESLLNMLLASRKINYRSFLKDCVSLLCRLYSQVREEFCNDLEFPENSVAKSAMKCDDSVSIASLELGNDTCVAIQKLLVLILELDVSRKEAEMRGETTRVDGMRTPLVEIILDELTYKKDLVPLFLQVFTEPKWKLEIILQYFWKYASLRTRKSNWPADDTTFIGLLNCFSDSAHAKGILKKIDPKLVQLLIAHAFQVHLLQLSGNNCKSVSEAEDIGGSLMEICKKTISAFESIRKTDEKMEILPFGKEAVFTASTMLSLLSQ